MRKRPRSPPVGGLLPMSISKPNHDGLHMRNPHALPPTTSSQWHERARSKSVNIVELLVARSVCSSGHRRLCRRAIGRWAERASVVMGTLSKLPLPASTRSTISLSFAPDRHTIASTHGDHTVKISCFHTRKVLAELHGHPRTPWTVKFHPTDSNIVVSGCIGRQVRVWDIRKRRCVRMEQLPLEIVSLCFDPSGEVLFLASGPCLWAWAYTVAHSTPHQLLVQPPRLRCVACAPVGGRLITGSANVDKGPNARHGINGRPEPTFRLVAWNVDFEDLKRRLERGDEPAMAVGARPALLASNAVLYNDGGIGFSPSGDCAVLVTYSNIEEEQSKSADNQSRTVEGEGNGSSELNGNGFIGGDNDSIGLGGNGYIRLDGNGSIVVDSGINVLERPSVVGTPTSGVSAQMRDVALATTSPELAARRPIMQPDAGSGILDVASVTGEAPTTPTAQSIFNNESNSNNNMDNISSNTMNNRSSNNNNMNTNTNTNTNNDNNNLNSSISQRTSRTVNGPPILVRRSAGAARRQRDRVMTSFAIGSSNSINNSATSLDDAGVEYGDSNTPPRVRPSQSIFVNRNISNRINLDSSQQQRPSAPPTADIWAARGVNPNRGNNNRDTRININTNFNINSNRDSNVGNEQSPRGIYSIALFSLVAGHEGDPIKLIELPGDMAKGVTSIKFSPECDHIVMGYGVRSSAPEQQQQSMFATMRREKHRVAAIFATYTPVEESLVHILLSEKDDSNTAEFHPDIGFGLAYGTRNGQVKLLGTQRSLGLGLDDFDTGSD